MKDEGDLVRVWQTEAEKLGEDGDAAIDIGGCDVSEAQS